MGNIINFMEKLGASADFQELSEAEVLEMLQQQNYTDGKQSGLNSVIEQLLDPRKNLVCGVMPAEEPNEQPEEQPEEEPEQPAPQKS